MPTVTIVKNTLQALDVSSQRMEKNCYSAQLGYLHPIKTSFSQLPLGLLALISARLDSNLSLFQPEPIFVPDPEG